MQRTNSVLRGIASNMMSRRDQEREVGGSEAVQESGFHPTKAQRAAEHLNRECCAPKRMNWKAYFGKGMENQLKGEKLEAGRPSEEATASARPQ